jgi:diaminopropionate ammonia-lyase
MTSVESRAGPVLDDADTQASLPDFEADVQRPLRLLRQCPVYKATQCHRIPYSRTGTLILKDETGRMGFGSFKALGGVYAVAALIADHWQMSHGSELLATDYARSEVRDFAGSLTFTCASAGNHGLAVAAGARIFGANARIFLADPVPGSFADRLREYGADIVRSGATYEESVAAATEDARASNSILLADSTWAGYWRTPALVMEGYTVLAEELRQSFETRNEWPTHVFLQAGVGGLAAAIAYMIRRDWPTQPQIVVVEPDAAPCLGESYNAGSVVEVEGPISNMGRLDCKVPSLLAFSILTSAGVEYETVSDKEAAIACDELERLGYPSTPSGAAGLAGLHKYYSATEPDKETRPLVIVTEGAVA